MTTTPGRPNPEPGWYADPTTPSLLRWWDGNAWTEHTAPASQPPPPSTAGSTALHWAVPVGRSGLAIAAGYLGLLSVLIPLAPISLVVGVLALRDIGAHPEKKGKGRAIFGIVMGALGTLLLVATVIGAALSGDS